MTKAELIKALEPFGDDMEIVIDSYPQINGFIEVNGFKRHMVVRSKSRRLPEGDFLSAWDERPSSFEVIEIC